MPNTEALKRLDRLQALIEKRPKFWTNHALAEVVRIRALLEPTDVDVHIGIAKVEVSEHVLNYLAPKPPEGVLSANSGGTLGGCNGKQEAGTGDSRGQRTEGNQPSGGG